MNVRPKVIDGSLCLVDTDNDDNVLHIFEDGWTDVNEFIVTLKSESEKVNGIDYSDPIYDE